MRNDIWIQCRPHPSDSARAQPERGKPLSSRVADDGKNGNVRRKLDHTGPDSEAARKVPADAAGVEQQRSSKAILLRRIGAPEGAAADLRAPGETADRDLRAPKKSGGHRAQAKAYPLYTLASPVIVLYMFTLHQFYIIWG